MCDMRGEPLPHVYMQHKPHPLLLLYLLACAVEHAGRHNGLPFILDFLPHLVVNDTAPNDTVRQFKEWWAQNTPFPDLMGDAAFGSLQSIKELKASNVRTLFSMPIDFEPYLWEVLSAGDSSLIIFFFLLHIYIYIFIF